MNLEIGVKSKEDQITVMINDALVPEKAIPCILENPDETSDVILEVEGKELHANRAVLAHYSPVFLKMFYSDFKEKCEANVSLPGKRYEEMAQFFNVLYPHNLTTMQLISDDNIRMLLTLADEYQADQVKVKCQEFIGKQLSARYRATVGYLTRKASVQQNSNPPSEQDLNFINQMILYLWMCDQYGLGRHRKEVKSLLLQYAYRLDDIAKRTHYTSLPAQTRIEVLEDLCRKLDGSKRQ